MDYGHQLIKRLLLGIGKVAKANSVTLLAPAEGGNPGHTILLKVGIDDAVPELSSLATALRFHQHNHQSLAPNEANKPLDFISSRDEDCVLLPIWTSLESGLNPHEILGQLKVPQRRASDQNDDEQRFESKLAGWIGLRFETVDLANQWRRRDPAHQELEHWVTELTGLLSLHLLRMRAVMHDGLTGLPGLGELHQNIAELLRQTSEEFCILMFNPTSFEVVNKELGRTKGDAILKAIADNVRLNLRGTDMLARFGSTVFAAVLPYTERKNAYIVARRVIENGLNGLGLDDVDMTIKCGIAVSQQEYSQQPQILVQQASQALRLAHQTPKSSIEVWNPNNLLQTKDLDPLISVFTGDMVRDYRRMALMWDTIGTIASQNDPDEMLKSLLSTLNRTLQADELHVYLKSHGNNDDISHRFGMKFNQQTSEGVHHPPTPSLISIAAQATGSGRLLGHGISGVATHNSRSSFPRMQQVLAAPMMVGNKAQGCLVLSRDSDTIWLDVSDVLFVQGLAAQLAIALDRVYLADQERRRQKSEFSTLRAALGQAKMLYQSETMNNLVRQAEQVANIDATVLITGESGTGKGVLARAIHDLSPRRSKNFVVVDCAAIPPNLIESELFGHVKGAFTGADRDNKGRLAEANQGTLFIDEIGELPPEVQGRLLTFVQDRQYFPVGSTRSRKIEVRIIAATNRRLEEEVKNGRFRQDLFFRLNVVNFQLPPLRLRKDEVLMFARYFIEQYRVQYSKPVRDLSTEASDALMKYSWPGNIRELQHRVLRAVIFSSEEELQLSDIELPGINFEQQLAAVGDQTTETLSNQEESPIEPSSQPVRSVNLTLQFSDVLRSLLQTYLREQAPWPFFPSVEFELIRAAHDWSLERARQGERGSTVKRASQRIGVPTATYRRKLQEAERTAEYPNGTDDALRPHAGLIRELVDTTTDTNLIRTWKQKAFEMAQELAPKDTKTGAQIFGTSEQTWRNWLSRGGPA